MNRFPTVRARCLIGAAFLRLSFCPPTPAQEVPTKKEESGGVVSNQTANEAAALTGVRALQEGLKLFRDQKFSEAAGIFTTITDSQSEALPKSHAYAWLARTDLHLHKIPEAEQAAQKALEWNKDSVNAQTAMAEVYFREGRLEGAETLLEPLAKSQTGTARTYLVLANIYRATGNYKAARTLTEAAHQMDPSDPDIAKSWFRSRTRQERMEELKRRLAEGRFEDAEDQAKLVATLRILEDREKNQGRSCRLVNSVSQTETKLVSLLRDAKSIRGFGLNVNLNDAAAILLLDSGAGGILINSKIAEHAGLSKIADTPIGGVGDKGSASGYVALAERLKIGALEFENCYVDVVDKKRSMDEDGLIGTNVFESYLVDIDFPNRKLRLSQLPPYPYELAERPSLQSESTVNSHLHNRWIPPEFSTYERVYRFGHMLLLPARLNDAPYRLFLLDTGAFDDTVTPSAAKEATKISTDYNRRVKGLSGEVKTVYTTGNLMLTFGHFQQRREMVAFDLSGVSNNVGTEISGTLGFAMLNLLEIKLDYRDNLVEFEFDPNRSH